MSTCAALQDSIEKLLDLLTGEELGELVEAFESVSNYRNGYGVIQIELERRRIKEIAVTSTVRPGSR